MEAERAKQMRLHYITHSKLHPSYQAILELAAG